MLGRRLRKDRNPHHLSALLATSLLAGQFAEHVEFLAATWARKTDRRHGADLARERGQRLNQYVRNSNGFEK